MAISFFIFLLFSACILLEYELLMGQVVRKHKGRIMPRNISFAMTTQQVQDRTKDVTRRFGWWFLKPGDKLCGVKKAMGLKKGEQIERLCNIEVVSVRSEPLDAITQGRCYPRRLP